MFPDNRARNSEIAEQAKTMSMAAVGRLHGLSRGRVKQIVDRSYRDAMRGLYWSDDLSARAQNVIAKGLGFGHGGAQVDVKEIARQICQFSEGWWLRHPEMGRQTLEEVRDWCREHGQTTFAPHFEKPDVG